jgi:hypothetical protein
MVDFEEFNLSNEDRLEIIQIIAAGDAKDVKGILRDFAYEDILFCYMDAFKSYLEVIADKVAYPLEKVPTYKEEALKEYARSRELLTEMLQLIDKWEEKLKND